MSMRKTKNRVLRFLLLLLISISVTVIYSFWPRPYKWIFIYYMSYDNDLSKYSNSILDDFAKGISDNKILVVTQADFNDVRGMKRVTLYHFLGITERRDTFIQSEDSTDPNELKKFLEWVGKKWKAENYCIVFLDHGGLLNDMCRDDRPSEDRSRNEKFTSGKWFSALEVSKIAADFNRSVNGKVRLLFLQQCARAAIQNLYNFHEASEYILASPLELWAPSTYYTKTLKLLTKAPDMTGKDLARNMMREDEQYAIYTLIDCNELKKLPEKLASVLDSFTMIENLKPSKNCVPLFEYGDEKFYDLKSYFQALSSANKTGEKVLQTFFDWSDNNLIVSKQININSKKPLDKSWHSGLSIFVPANEEQRSRYDFLPLYQDTNLKEILYP